MPSKTWGVKLSEAQIEMIRAEFPEKDWDNNSELIKTVFNDYFTARGKQFPADEHAYGKQDTGTGRGKR